MTSVCDTVSDAAVLVGAVAEKTSAFTIERGAGSSAATFVIAAMFADTIIGTDARIDSFASIVTESAALTSAVAQALTARDLVEDTAALTSVIRSRYLVSISDSAVLTNASTQKLSALTIESAAAGDAVSTLLSASTMVVDAAVLAAVCPPFMTNYVVEPIIGTDATTYLNTATATVSDSAVMTDVVTSRGIYRQQVEDGAVITDSFTTRLTASNSIIDEAFIGDFTTGPAGSAWTALAQTWGMSRYTNMPFNSVATIGGKTVLSGDSGFYTLDADNDGGSEISSRFDLGKYEAKGGFLQRPREIYIGYKGGQLAADVTAPVNGSSATYSYAFPAKTANTDDVNKVEPGRGLRSRYFAFSFKNQNGSGFQVHDARILFDDTSRRV